VSDIKYLDSSNYEEFIASGVVVVDFFADWCGPCKMMGPILEQAQIDYEGKAIIAKVNVDENKDLAVQNKIMGIPTLFFFKDGKVVDRTSGVLDKGALYTKIDSLL